MWMKAEVFFWPFFGWGIAPGVPPFWPLAWERAMSDPWRWVLDAVGLAYLIWLWFATGLNRADRRESFFATGRLPDRVGQGV
jgi:hypothetical protein